MFYHRLKTQIPDIKGTLETVKHLKENKTETIKTQFMLADNLYVKAQVPPTDKVGLWLGVSLIHILGSINFTKGLNQ